MFESYDHKCTATFLCITVYRGLDFGMGKIGSCSGAPATCMGPRHIPEKV